ncbi:MULTISPECIES: site-specific integrase [Piscinibacter]|uniref:site-specific integrase n=1 Tax=Piscinibacter TaxID=1114981 RepID=UPI0013E35A18|nr:site-specific integrase [Piscinibacter defluvii]
MQAFDDDLLSLAEAVLGRQLTYREAASQLGVVRSTVERRVKGLVRRLNQAGLLGDFRAEWINDLATLRRERATIMAAAKEFRSPLPGKRAAVPDQRKLAEAAARLRVKSGAGDRDAALVWTLFTTGLKTIELARLEVRDYLLADGSTRTVSTLRPEAAVNGAARPLLFTSQLAVESIDAYLDARVHRMQGLGELGRYRGLDPNSRLFLTESGGPFLITPRSPSDPRPTCKYLQATLRQVFARAGWAGMTAQQLRRHVALAMSRKGADRDQVQQLLGLRSRRSVKRLTSTAEVSADSSTAAL